MFEPIHAATYFARMQQQIDVEETRDALKQGIYACVQNVGLLAQQGMDQSEILTRVADIIRDRQKGDQLEASLSEPSPRRLRRPNSRRPPGEAGATEPGCVARARQRPVFRWAPPQVRPGSAPVADTICRCCLPVSGAAVNPSCPHPSAAGSRHKGEALPPPSGRASPALQVARSRFRFSHP